MYFVPKKLVLSKKQEALIDIINEHDRLSRNEFLRIVQEQNPILEVKGAAMSHQTFQNELDDLVRREIVIKEPQTIGKKLWVYYSLPQLTETEKQMVDKFERAFEAANAVIQNIKNENYRHLPPDDEMYDPTLPNNTKKGKKKNTSGFVREAINYLMIQKVLLEKVYHMFPRTKHSKILKDGEEIFENMDREFEELRAKYDISEMALIEGLFFHAEAQWYHIDELYDPICYGWNIEFGNDDS